ncbi:MAG: RNA polymerase sigma factor [Nitriliruptorales bacterium]|nr:RNA polymerase sigma factor [Nitriliruptorales bacterium]
MHRTSVVDIRDDRELLAGVADGDRDALRVLHERHTPWLALRLHRRCNDRGLVDEVIQDTFLAVWRAPNRYRGDGEVAAWLWGIAVRRLIDGFRREKVRPSLAAEEAPEGMVSSLTPSSEELALLGVEFGDLSGALERLSPELRAVVQATVLDGLTSRETAAYLGIPTGTVKTRMQRARAQLREALT